MSATKTKPAKSKPATKPAPAKPATPVKTAAEQQASDTKFYSTLEAHGVEINNPRSGKRLGRFILQAHCLAQCWPAKPMTVEQIAELCSKRFGIRITTKRVERQLIDELRTGRVVKKNGKYAKTNVAANYWSLNQ